MRCRYFIVIEKRECTQTHTKKYAYYFEFLCTLIRERELRETTEYMTEEIEFHLYGI